jgi:hypothetical protein
MTEQRRVKRVLWLVIPAALGAGTLYGVLARSGDSEARGPSAAEKNVAEDVQQNPSSMAKAAELSKSRGVDAATRIAEQYGAWANDPSAFAARKVLLAKLFSEKDLAQRLSGVLTAIEADPTPPEKDPLWEQIATQLADLWKGEVATKAMDLALAEKRPRAHRALISSFVVIATSDRVKELTPPQRQTLTETMIDVSSHAQGAQKKELDPALRALGGNDLADIMAGKGIDGKDGHELESERAYKASLEQTKKEVADTGQAVAP